MSDASVEVPCIVDGEEVFTGEVTEATAPHDHANKLCRWHGATEEVVARALAAARRAWREWSETPHDVRLSIFQKAADILAGPERDTVNAATMLGQSKTCFQAEIDSACELIDFWRFNPWFARHKIYAEQPASAPGTRNVLDHRPLEGFVYAVTPFNFTSIGGNLPTAPAMLGNVVLWKPSSSAVLSNYHVMRVLMQAGLPPGVVNFVPGRPSPITRQLLAQPDFAGVHYTGSTAVFNGLWKQIAEGIDGYRTYPRIVGETGGKDFIFVHPSADVTAVSVAATRGAFEYQGQKCSAASRMFVPRSLWKALRDDMVPRIRSLPMGDPADFSNFLCAVITERAFQDISGYVERARKGARIVVGGTCDRSRGWFIEPTVVECEDPTYESMREEIFGPVLSVHVYEDARLDDALTLCDEGSPYGLTGSVFAQDRLAAEKVSRRLRHAAGNFYVNDKPTGAVVNQQPFGGARASGTDDKAGSPLNLMRWVAPRTVKETFLPPHDHRYPHMG
jgi:1-pyrroline-5-carboxylate dehydrogenase